MSTVDKPYEKNFYTTTRGVKLELLGISPMFIAKLQTGGEIPPTPTRKIATAIADYEETEELSEDDLQNDEEKKIWKEFEEKRDAVLARRQNNFMKAIFDKGVKVDLTDIEAWKLDQEFYGIELPTHPTDLKVEYIQTELIGGMEDILQIITGVLSLTGVPKEEMASVEAMFRGALRSNPTEEAVPATR